MSRRGLGALIACCSSGLSVIALVIGLTYGSGWLVAGLLTMALVTFVVGASIVWSERNS